MKKYPMTKEIRIPNDQMIWAARANGSENSCFGFRHSFVIGYFFIRHF